MKMITAFVVRAVGFCAQHAWPVIGVSLLLAVLSGWYAATHFAMTTDVNQLISSHIDWRQREAALEKAFPQFESIVAVIDAPTPELVDEATTALAQRLPQQKDLIFTVEQPQGRQLFRAERPAVRAGRYAQAADGDADPGAAAVAGAGRRSDPARRHSGAAVRAARRAGRRDHARLDDLADDASPPTRIDKVNAGQPASFSWQELVQGRAASADDRLRFLEIQAALDYSELEPGQRATDYIRKAAADLDFASKYQARLRLTGPVPMADEEFATIKENAGLNATVTIAVVLLILWLALRWVRIIFAVFACLIVGLAMTAAAGLLMVGTLNLISVYFAVLFVGLGVDFGLQFSVRYRAERHDIDNVQGALLEAARRAGAPLTLAALATAAGFLSFLPTVYKGVSELGLIAGVGMLIAFATSITLLPALLAVLKPPAEPAQLGYAVLAPVDDFLSRNRVPILIITGIVVAAGLPLLFWLRFDFNPINLRSPTVESVATYLDLKNDPQSGANDIQILEPSLAAADQAAAKLRALPQVSRVVTLSTFIPERSAAKTAFDRSRGGKH